MHQIILFARLALGAVFAVAAFKKSRDWRGVASGLEQFGVPRVVAPATTLLLVVSECAVAAALIFDATAIAGALGAVGLLAVFTIVIVASLARGRRPACNCFGADEERAIGWDTVARNLALIAVGALVAARGTDAPLLATIAAPVNVATALALFVPVTFVLWQIARQQGRILLRLEAFEESESYEAQPAAAPHRQGLPIGSEAPAFALATVDNEQEKSLADLDDLGQPVLLLFANPGCGPCRALLPEVARWQSDYARSLTVAIVSEGTIEDNRSKTIPGLKHVLLQREREIAAAYQAYGTPAAVLVDDGRIASWVAQGADEIRTLVANFFDGRPRAALANGDTMPDVTLANPAGAKVDLRDVVAASEETVLVFWNPQCGFCSNMLDDLRAWENGRGEGDPQLAIISSAPIGENGAFKSLVLIDSGSQAAAAFGASGTPMAIRIDANGAVGSKIVAGREAVLDLLRSTARAKA
jgi:thiol-disulfide isomerase/thioredoxin/uncharacterized membrane protein YphA (DoxX/SURF4 family)